MPNKITNPYPLIVLMSTGSGSNISGANLIPSTSLRRMYSGSSCSLNLANSNLESFFGSADWSSSTTWLQNVQWNSCDAKSKSWSAFNSIEKNYLQFKCLNLYLHTSKSVNVFPQPGHLKLALLVASLSSVSILFLIRSNLYFTTFTNVL